MSKSILKRIQKYNKGRNPEVLKLKYEALKESAFRFYRGTCHLFYEDLPKKSFLLKSPRTWVCGDLHLENFGSFKGDNRLAYFDENDFDEAMLAPCLLDVARLCTSIYLTSTLVKLNKADCTKLAKLFIETYSRHLCNGRIRFIEKESAKGVIKEFLDQVATRKRKDLIKRFVVQNGSNLSLKLSDKVLPVSKEIKHKVKRAIEGWAVKNATSASFYQVMDVALRANGTGSLGVNRYLILVKGKESGHYLLDLKESAPASALNFIKLKQPKWSNEAERIIEIQRRVQTAAPAHLHPIKFNNKWCVMKELQPFDDKIDFKVLEENFNNYSRLITDMGAILAWNNLRCGGRQGSAIADDMIKFGKQVAKHQKEILAYAENYAAVTTEYWKEYVKATAKTAAN